MKVVLILVDGMRPDALAAVPKAQEIMKKIVILPEHKNGHAFCNAAVPYVAVSQRGSHQAWDYNKYICAAGAPDSRTVRGFKPKQ